MKISGIILMCVILMSCATAPEDITPTYVSALEFNKYTCDQIAEEIHLTEIALKTASKAQDKARSNDTWGVLLLGVPVSSLSGGNQHAHIANLKGTLDALNKVNINKLCFKP